MTTPTSPAQLTGAYVRQVRESRKLSRNDFIGLLEGPHWKTQTRLGNIETRDSWKEGDREDIWAALLRLESGELPSSAPPSPNGEVERSAGEDAPPSPSSVDSGADETVSAALTPDWMLQPLDPYLVLVEDVDTIDPLLAPVAGEGAVAPSASFPSLP